MDRRLLIVVLCMLIAMVLCSTNIAVAVDELDVTGTVRGRNNDLKQFASVQLEGPRRYVAMTGASGQFKISNVVLGLYTVRVRQGDYVTTFPSMEIKNNTMNLVVNW
jgi:hypothetical protein